MAGPIITVEHLGKRYVLSHQRPERYVALRDVMADRLRGLWKRQAQRTTREEFMALEDVSFNVHPGDRVGIIGRNGAGKSTLLKVLGRIVEPSAGRITIGGRVASLLEVGTGFHPELTGRENIYLNGAILGMRRAEIKARFDEIVDFAEVEKFLDTPVKRYSSGMYVRLAFAVAAHLEPEILIVDEVLAVGDSKFQRKCLGKMEDVAGQGRTILFVSHQMDAVQRLCNRGLLLQRGRLIAEGPMAEMVAEYLGNNAPTEADTAFEPPTLSDAPAHITHLRIQDPQGMPLPEVPMGAPWQAIIRFKVLRPIDGFVIGLGITTQLDLPVRTTWSAEKPLRPGNYEARFTNDGIDLAEGQYKLQIGLSDQGRVLQYVPDAAILAISAISTLGSDSRVVTTKGGLIMNQMPADIHPID